MLPNTSLNTFPANPIQAISMLYVENQNLEGKTPEEIFDLYMQTYERIKDYRGSQQARSWLKKED